MRTPERKLVYRDAVEAVARGALPRLLPSSKERLRGAGIDLDRPLQAAYPSDAFVALVRVATEALFPGVPPAEAYRRLGRLTVESIEQTLLGKAQIKLARVVGPMKALLRLGKNVETASNHASTITRQLDDKTMELAITGFELPYGEFQVGVCEGILWMFANAGKAELIGFDPAQQSVSVRVTLA